VKTQPWSAENSARALAFLKENYATSMFILGNLEDHGSTLGTHPNSGNFKVLLDGEKIVGVYCLARRGNLILTTPSDRKTSELILQECLSESLPIKGVLGEWRASSSIWALLRENEIVATCSYESKEILYALSKTSVTTPVPEVRFLNKDDFAEWAPIQRAYLAEEGLLDDLAQDFLRSNFELKTGQKRILGFFENGRMIATAALNAKALDIGQVGGVYTVPELRRQGYSKRTMKQLISDCATVHGITRMILFTGEKNFAAQAVYEKQGFERIGHFGMFFA
jgi:predicted GNAT family acetyltransferase